MSAPWADVFVTVHAPITVATNVALAIQGAVLSALLRRRGREEVARLWSLFFLFMGLATLVGTLKHALAPASRGDLWLGSLRMSNAFGGLGTAAAQLATIRTWLRDPLARRTLRAGIHAQFGGFALSNVLWPGFTPGLVHTALGLGPVLVVEALATRGSRPGNGWIAAGLGAAALAGVTYALRISAGQWLDHNDLAHFAMMASLALLFPGAVVRCRLRTDALPLAQRDRAVHAMAGGSHG